MPDDLKHTPMEAVHIAHHAKLVPFAGWLMPVQYTSILEEHKAVRTKAGIFDISHMGQFIVAGQGAAAWLNRMFTNNVANLAIGQGQYSLMLNENGGVIDDLILYRTAAEQYFIVVNASMIDVDFSWLSQHKPEEISLTNESDSWAGMAIQGPESAAIFQAIAPGQELPPRNGIAQLPCGCVICRTGYTGEDGFELFAPAAAGEKMWRKFTAAGAVPCGLGARDTLRLEMCYPLNGNDLSPTHTPIEAGLGFFCDLEKDEFIGREILRRQKTEGPAQRLAAIQYTEKGAPPRAHYPVVAESGETIGELTSGALSPSLMTGIGMAYLPAALAKPGTPIQINVRGRLFPATVVKKPFYKKA